MSSDPAKVSPKHLHRDAYLYVRQSTLRQVMENTESTQRQYALRERAIALGWPIERVQVIDCDQGQSGASAAGREGFRRLVAVAAGGRSCQRGEKIGWTDCAHDGGRLCPPPAFPVPT